MNKLILDAASNDYWEDIKWEAKRIPSNYDDFQFFPHRKLILQKYYFRFFLTV